MQKVDVLIIKEALLHLETQNSLEQKDIKGDQSCYGGTLLEIEFLEFVRLTEISIQQNTLNYLRTFF